MATPEEYLPTLEDMISTVSSEGDSNSKAKSKLVTASQKDNLADEFDLPAVREQLTRQFAKDKGEMSDWFRKYERALQLALMDSEKEDKTFPWPKASKVMAPFLLQAAIRFNSEININILSKDEPADFKVVGNDFDGQKEARAERQRTYFNAKLHKGSWYDESDKEGILLPLAGTSYKKVMFDALAIEVGSFKVQPDKIIFSQKVSRFEEAPQVAHCLEFSRNELIGNKNLGLWDFDESKMDEDTQTFKGKEFHFWYDWDEDGFQEPWIATYIDEIDEIVRIRAGFLEENIHDHNGKITHIDRKEYFVQKQLIPDPEGKPMGLGWGVILSDMYATINTNLRQMVDAGTLANVGGSSGFIANTLQPKMNQNQRMQEGYIELEMGKFKTLQVSSGASLSQNVLQLPFKGPNASLFQLLEYLDQSAKQFTMASYNLESGANEASILYLAKLKEAMKDYNAMMYRVYRGFTKEFDLMCRCYYEYAEYFADDYKTVLDEADGVPVDIEADFNPVNCDVVPTGNPAHGSSMEKMAKAQAVLDTAQLPIAQGQVNNRQALLDYYEAADIENLDLLMPEPTGEPTALELQQQQYMQMEMMERQMNAEFRNREMVLKETKLAMELQREAMQLEQDEMLNGSQVNLNQAKALKEMAGIALDKARMYQEILDKGEENLKQQGAKNATSTSNGNSGRNRNMASKSNNQDIY